MNKKILVLSMLALTSSGAMAQSAFEGFYGQVGVGYESVTPYFTGGTVAGRGYTISASNANSFAGTVGVGFNFPITSTFLLGLGAEYAPINGNKANSTLTVPGVISSTTTYNKKDSYNIFVSPGFVIDKNSLAYGKIGYTGATVESDGSLDLTGISLGVGYKQIIKDGLYGFGEVNYSNYGNVSISNIATGSVSAETINIIVGVGYKF